MKMKKIIVEMLFFVIRASRDRNDLRDWEKQHPKKLLLLFPFLLIHNLINFRV